MSSQDIKAGDTVRCLESCDDQYTRHKTYVVDKIDEDGWVCTLDDNGEDNGMHPNCFEKVSSAIKEGDNVVFKRYSSGHAKYDLTVGKVYKVIRKHDHLMVEDDAGDFRALKDSFEKVGEDLIFQDISDRIQKLIDDSQEAIDKNKETINKLTACRNLLTS